MIGDETTKVFLNTRGALQDVDEEMMEFLKYIENSTDEVAKAAKSELVRIINQKVNMLKEDKKVEVEYMTLLERDKEKIQEGIERGIEQGIEQGIVKASKQMAKKLLDKGMNIEEVISITELTKEEVEEIYNTGILEREQGIVKASKQMAKKLLDKGMNIEEVISITELTKEEVEEIYNTGILERY